VVDETTTCDVSACLAAARETPGGQNQCKQPTCKGGVCEFSAGLSQVDGSPCDDGDSSTELDECDAGVCRGWTLVARQSAPLADADAVLANPETKHESNSHFFDLGVVNNLMDDYGAVELAMRWPGTLFSTQVWSQTSLPWQQNSNSDGTSSPRRATNPTTTHSTRKMALSPHLSLFHAFFLPQPAAQPICLRLQIPARAASHQVA
jgi:hypothetical protein